MIINRRISYICFDSFGRSEHFHFFPQKDKLQDKDTTELKNDLNYANTSNKNVCETSSLQSELLQSETIFVEKNFTELKDK